jgi:hypothetical protein
MEDATPALVVCQQKQAFAPCEAAVQGIDCLQVALSTAIRLQLQAWVLNAHANIPVQIESDVQPLHPAASNATASNCTVGFNLYLHCIVVSCVPTPS